MSSIKNRYTASNEALIRAERVIPLGSQTFSKSKIAYPDGVAPLFISRGKGCQVWDIDGNEYTDYVSGLLSVSIGYADETINDAVIKQLQNGVSFSLPHQLETIVAEKIVDYVPCAEMVRFGKNGSDATSAAIRLARAYTKREHVAVCGYHGWQDWYIGSTTRDLGVPEATKALTHQFQFNNIDSLQALLANQSIAAVIMEPMNVEYPTEGFLADVKALCQAHGAILIFDETITGFRFNLGGAQQLFNVTPDLATFGKGMANGFPISAVVGRKDIMLLMEDVFFSGTFAGETMSLAATNAVLDKLKSDKVLEHIEQMGQLLIDGLNDIIVRNDASGFMKVSGHPSWVFLHITDSKHHSALLLKSYYLQEMLVRGILINASHNLSFSHKRSDIDHLLTIYNEVIANIVELDRSQSIAEHFEGQVMKPVFKVR
jgi:glutamate-1-semialdehyde 2,1-aminomutase